MKAILVIDMPIRCYFCRLYNAFENTCKATGSRVRTEHLIANNRLEDCPLKPIPEKQKEVEDTDYIYEDYDRMAACIVGQIEGWNSCIEEILGEEE